MLKTSLPRIKILVASINKIVTLFTNNSTHFYKLSRKVKAPFGQRYREHDNYYVHNSEIYSGAVKISSRKIYGASIWHGR